MASECLGSCVTIRMVWPALCSFNRKKSRGRIVRGDLVRDFRGLVARDDLGLLIDQGGAMAHALLARPPESCAGRLQSGGRQGPTSASSASFSLLFVRDAMDNIARDQVFQRVRYGTRI